MAASIPSYGLIDARSRCLFIINAQPGDEHLDNLIAVNLDPSQETMLHEDYEDDEWCLLIDDGPAYSTLWMEITMNRGSIAIARFVDGSHEEIDDEVPMQIARFIVGLEEESKSVHADGLTEEKISELLRVTIIKGKCKEDEEEEEGEGEGEGEEEICAICHEEFEAGHAIGTVESGHAYHEICIKKWLVKKNLCPICRSTALS